MATTRARRARPPPPKTLDDLRPLLVGPEQSRIRRLEDRLDRHLAEMVAEVLPQAITESRKRGEALSWAMEPILGSAVRDSVQRDPGGFAEAIAPAMAPATRKAVSSMLRAMLQRLNEALDRSLSLESLRWRLEARRSGRSFAEVALLRTLIYRVEQIFLIHRGTGLFLGHQSAEDIPCRDPDQISAMLSAIEAFAYEAFHAEGRLESFRMGDLSAWVEHGPSAALVAVVRGVAPQDYELVLRETLERIHLHYGSQLADFRGNTAPFSGIHDLLSSCLREQRRPPARRGRAMLIAVAALVAVCATVLGLHLRASSQDARRFAVHVEALRREPGLVVISAERRSGHSTFTGLRDPLASDPSEVLSRQGASPAAVTLRFEPFYSLDPRIVARRAEQALRPPPEVSLILRGATLSAVGVAPERWIERARWAAPALPGVLAFDDARLHPREAIEQAWAAERAIEGTEIVFSRGSTQLPAGQSARLDEIAAAARRLVALTPQAGMTVEIRVLGYADPTGSEAANQAISQARAERVAVELGARGVPPDRLRARGAGVRRDVLPSSCASDASGARCRPGAGAARARSVIFAVDLREVVED